MKPFTLALVMNLAATSAHSTTSCIDLTVSVNRYDAMNQHGERTGPQQAVFDYGDFFELLIDGTYPGTYFIENISPAGVRTRVGPAAYSDGVRPILLPCGLEGMCATGTERFRFIDDHPDRPTGSTSDEMLIVYYLPCRTGDPARDRNIGALAERLPYCHGAPEPFPENHRFQTMRPESIALVDPVTQVCTLPPAGEPILLYERVTLTARR